MLSSGLSSNVLLLFSVSDNFIPTLNLGRVYFKDFYDFLIFFSIFGNVWKQENMRGQRGTLSAYALSLKLFIDWFTNGRCVFRDVRIKTTMSSI